MFNAICEHFASISKPLLPLSFLEVFTKISGKFNIINNNINIIHYYLFRYMQYTSVHLYCILYYLHVNADCILLYLYYCIMTIALIIV